MCQDEANGNATTTQHLNSRGCKDALTDLLINNALILFGIGIGVAAFELIVILMAIGFACNIEKD